MALFTVVLILWAVMIIIRPTSSMSGFSKENTLPLRGLLSVLIIIHHVSQRLSYCCPETSWCRYLYQFNTWGYLIVSVFFFLTGYGLMKSYMLKKDVYLSNFISKRIVKIVTPFVICVILYTIVNVCICGNVINYGFDAWRQDCPLLPNTWYVIAVVIFYVSFYVIARIIHNESRLIAGMFAFTLVYMILLYILGFKRYWWYTTPCICVGMIMAYKELFFSSFFQKKKASVLLVVFIWMLVFIVDPIYYSYNADYLTSLLVSIARSISVAMFVYVCISVAGFVRNVTFRFLGDVSYEIYLVQGGVTSLLFPSIGKYPIFYIVSSLLLSVLLAYMLKKSASKLIGKRTGLCQVSL